MNRVLSLLAIVCLFIFLPSRHVAAQVILNEYYPNPAGSSEAEEWVELYNTTDESVSLSAWKVDDTLAGGSAAYVFPENIIIAGKGFLVIDRTTSGIVLNNDSDTINLLNSNDQIVDTYGYNEADEGISYGRLTDGGSEWVRFSSSSKGSTNISGTSIPSPTLTPQPTEIPTRTPTPTKLPMPSKTPELTATPLPTRKPTVMPTQVFTTSPNKNIPTAKLHERAAVLGSEAIHTSSPSAPDPVPTIAVLESSSNTHASLFMVAGGVLFVACGILTFYIRRKAEV